jgi:ankyrin repeat protein
MKQILNSLKNCEAQQLPGKGKANEEDSNVRSIRTKAETDSYQSFVLPHGTERNKWQPALNQAIMRNDNDAVKRFLGRGADVNKPDPKNGFSPIIVAASVGSSSQVFQTILAANPEVNVTAPSGLKLTALSKCALNGDVAGVEMLLRAGAELGSEPYWDHAPYSIVSNVEEWHPKFEEFKKIKAMFDREMEIKRNSVSCSTASVSL